MKRCVCKKVALFADMAREYSGGRYYLIQYAWTLATIGAEVYVRCAFRPDWLSDFAPTPNLRWALRGIEELPADIDLVVTDNKGPRLVEAAAARDARWPTARLVGFNFETPNWVRSLGQNRIADNMAWHADTIPTARRIDLHISCTEAANPWLREWLGQPEAVCAALPPAFNSARISDETAPLGVLGFPYAAYVAGVAPESNVRIAVDAVLACPEPMDLVLIGHENYFKPVVARQTPAHRLHVFHQAPDALKFALLREARMLLCPTEFEGFGMCPMEALAVGTPVVTYDLPVTREVYGDRCAYVPLRDEGAFVQAAVDLASRPKRSDPEAAAFATERYSLKAMRRRIERLPYHGLIRQRVTGLIQAAGDAGPILEACLRSVDSELDAIVAVGDCAAAVSRAAPHPEKVRACPALAEADRMLADPFLLIVNPWEVWSGLAEWIAESPAGGSPKVVHFWGGRGHWMHDAGNMGEWGRRVQPFGVTTAMFRFGPWRPSDRLSRFAAPLGADDQDETNAALFRACPEPTVYSFAHFDKTKPPPTGAREVVTWPLPPPVARLCGRLEGEA